MSERQGLIVHKLAGDEVWSIGADGQPVSTRPLAGVRLYEPQAFADSAGSERTMHVPASFRMPHDYPGKHADWIDLVDTDVVHKPGGPEADPWRVTHTFVHARQMVLHLVDGDVTYDVVGQPDKYDADGNPTDAAGDPTAEVRWYYDCDLAAPADKE